MTVKELKKKLRGKYTIMLAYSAEHRGAAPFTMMGLSGLSGRAFGKALDAKEVVEWHLTEPQKTASLNLAGGNGRWKCKDETYLKVYVK